MDATENEDLSDDAVELTDIESREELFTNKLAEVLQLHRQAKLPAQSEQSRCPFCENHNGSCGYFRPSDPLPGKAVVTRVTDNPSPKSNQGRTMLLKKVIESLAGQAISVETTTDDEYPFDLGANLGIAYRRIQPVGYLLEMPLLHQIWNWGRPEGILSLDPVLFPSLVLQNSLFELTNLDDASQQQIRSSVQQVFSDCGVASELEWNAVELHDDTLTEGPVNPDWVPNAVELLDRRLLSICAELSYLRLASLEEALFLKLRDNPPQYPCSNLAALQNRLHQSLSEIAQMLKTHVI